MNTGTINAGNCLKGRLHHDEKQVYQEQDDQARVRPRREQRSNLWGTSISVRYLPTVKATPRRNATLAVFTEVAARTRGKCARRSAYKLVRSAHALE
jgi:hypothetical protein